MIAWVLLGIVLLVGLGLAAVRWQRGARDRAAWVELAQAYPSPGEIEGTRFDYPVSGGEATIGRERFRAQPRADLPAIEVEWSRVRSVQPGPRGGVEAHLREGVVLLPGAASAAIAHVVAERARRQLV